MSRVRSKDTKPELIVRPAVMLSTDKTVTFGHGKRSQLDS